ncbi:hypothetical protein FC57_GL001593 [Lactobacillus ultunensis DSM 16047]|uniref:Branched-chain amino acid transport system carrier protein n=1 Tax=Lactobacillus ultunensis DSM 16047 TaxID=525365 RepID=C2EQ96_9LACO|nr:hypothetical protein HMPREF0548_1842 [Lactobacillus ultunensis DSM 16047]KRL80052.1 hypothetical protein FC57_GL001593 [Lactobacillus ultunensis DSM 16047]
MNEIEKIERDLSKKDYFVISSMLFALFFGAGNLIFPLHLGQLAGHNWLLAAVGFLITVYYYLYFLYLLWLLCMQMESMILGYR